jgi:hypothetical protein
MHCNNNILHCNNSAQIIAAAITVVIHSRQTKQMIFSMCANNEELEANAKELAHVRDLESVAGQGDELEG